MVKSINFVISGEAGQGIESALEMAGEILHKSLYHVFTSSEYMSRIRGGCNSGLVKVSDQRAPYFSKRIDYLFVLDEKAIEHLKERISPKTVIVECKKSNIYALGYIAGLLKINSEKAESILSEKFEKIFKQEKNKTFFKKGHSDSLKAGANIEIMKDISLKTKKLANGNFALGLGSIAGGANFISFYPMSPSTEYSTFLSNAGDDFGVLAEQAEDEISAINMALGASYAGARACVSTSGGGFALMCEGISLAGMMDLPVVVHLAQRPAPATGLPTRTAQEDLNLALYSGHGEFERIIYSPANVQDSFEIGQMSFEHAQKYRLPTFMLTEQALLEATYAIDTPEFEENQNYSEKLPGTSEKLVNADSDEHDELGYITEDPKVRTQMVEKRLSKRKDTEKDILPPYFEGEAGYEKLLVSWGSNYEVLKAAIQEREDFALLHFRQLWPLDEVVLTYAKGKTLVVAEQNATGQLSKLLRQEFGLEADYRLLKYDGQPFAIEEVEEVLNGIR